MGQVTGLEICFDCLLKIKNITYIKLQSYKDNYTCMHAITQMEIIQKILNLYARGMNLMEFTLYTLQQQKKKTRKQILKYFLRIFIHQFIQNYLFFTLHAFYFPLGIQNDS